jgi:hypothetical protein
MKALLKTLNNIGGFNPKIQIDPNRSIFRNILLNTEAFILRSLEELFQLKRFTILQFKPITISYILIHHHDDDEDIYEELDEALEYEDAWSANSNENKRAKHAKRVKCFVDKENAESDKDKDDKDDEKDDDEDDNDDEERRILKIIMGQEASDEEEQQKQAQAQKRWLKEKITALKNILNKMSSNKRSKLFNDLGIKNRNTRNLLNALIRRNFVFNKNVIKYNVIQFVKNLKNKKIRNKKIKNKK